MKNGSMKKVLKLFAVPVLALLTFASCNREIEGTETVAQLGKQITITAIHADDATRTTLIDGGTEVYWQPGDSIALYLKDKSSLSYYYTKYKLFAAISEASKAAPFSGYIKEGGSTPYIGCFPYTRFGDKQSGRLIEFDVPYEQTAKEDSFGPEYWCTIGCASSSEMLFYALCGGFRFTLGEEGIEQVTLQAIGKESISGSARANIENMPPTIQYPSASSSAIILNAPGGESFKTNTWYYIVAMPAELKQGFRLTFKKGDSIGIRDFTNPVSFKRGVIGSKRDVDEGVEFYQVASSENNHECIDLCLSVKWATCNIGANSPEEVGDFFAWGETSAKDSYDWTNYKWGNVEDKQLTKYNQRWDYGPIDNKTILELEDDAARSACGGNWRMPTKDELEELINNTVRTETSLNGVYGILFTSKENGASLFFPYKKKNHPIRIWTSELAEASNSSSLKGLKDVTKAYAYSSMYGIYRETRCSDMVIRPVIDDCPSSTIPVRGVIIGNGENICVAVNTTCVLNANVYPVTAGNKNVIWSIEDNSVASVSATGEINALSTGITSITARTEDGGFTANCTLYVANLEADNSDNGHDYVDLGNGEKWATCNIGASLPEEFGDYFAFGETAPKSSYSWKNYIWYNGDGNPLLKYDVVDRETVFLEDCDDAAYVTWGGEWRLPYTQPLNGKSYKTIYKGISGILYTSQIEGNNKSIFLSNGGCLDDTTLLYENVSDCYWHAAEYDEYFFYRGQNIRPVIRDYYPVESLGVYYMHGSEYGYESYYSLVLSAIGQSIQLEVGFTPFYATNRNVTWESSDPSVVVVSSTGLVTAVSYGAATITVTSVENDTITDTFDIVVLDVNGDGVENGHNWIDLGLSVKWAACNIGAEKPSEKGEEYFWGQTSDATDSEYITGKYTSESGALDISDDTANALWGGNWRLPTHEEQAELINNCTWQYVEVDWPEHDWLKGFVVRSKMDGYTGKSVFIPIVLSHWSSSATHQGAYGFGYWSATYTHSLSIITPHCFYFSEDRDDPTYGKGYNQSYGFGSESFSNSQCIRPVLSVNIPVEGIELNQSNATLPVGQTLQLTASILPADASSKGVTWSSSNPSVADVSISGLVTAYTAGSADITATTKDGGYTAKCKVSVVVPATGVSLNTTKLTFTAAEQTASLTASVTPSNASNQNVSWTSSNTSVASVSASGVVTAKSGGTATITVTTEDGGFTATCDVTVTIAVSSVSLNKSNLSLKPGETYQLTASVSPSDANNKAVSWKSSNAAVAKVSDSGLVTAVTDGTASITVTTDDGGHTASCSVIVSSKPDPETITFSELGLTNAVQYSDPFNGGNFTITFGGGGNDGKYYNTGAGIRTYGGGTITVSSSHTISKIAYTWDGSYCPTDDVATPSGYSTDTTNWTGSAKTVTLTRPSGTGHWRLKSVTVTYSD